MPRGSDRNTAPTAVASPEGLDVPLGIVIPTLNEAAALPELLADLSHLTVRHRVVVVDGGSADRTREIARATGASILSSAPGRGVQMNAGAASLDTDWITFLHADSRLPPTSLAALEEWITHARARDVGHFQFRLAGRGTFNRVVELGQRMREELFGLVYGDQGLVISRRLFSEMGGFADLPIMEDVELVRRIRDRGRILRIPGEIWTSPRRYEAEGKLRGLARNIMLTTLFRVGVPAERLSPLYPAHTPSPRNTLLIFAKAPTPGRVKTRLASAVGPEVAARIYRKLGRSVTDQLRDGPYRTVVCFDPPEARAEVEQWLGPDDLDYRPQSRGDLGDRMSRAFQRAFADSDRVVIVGTDAPGVDRALVEEAFDALADEGVVIGPARDGGYYLLGLRKEAPELFRNIEWSTEGVLDATMERARGLGLQIHLLRTLTDVDTLADLEALTR